MPAVPPYIIEPIWKLFSDLLPAREEDHPLDCHRPRVPYRMVFEKLVEVLALKAHRGSLEPLPLGKPSCTATMTY